MLTLLLLFFQVVAPVTPLQVPELSPPVRQGVPPTPAEGPILREGIALFDQQKYDEAIARFEAVLKNNPENVVALYELGQTYWRKREFQKAIDAAAKAAQFNAPALPQVYALMGNVLDANREPQRAVEMYQKGIALNTPNAGILYLNMGVTYQSAFRDVVAAKATFKQGALADPNYPGNHFHLANIYAAQGLKTAVLMAAGRFLVLEPNTARTQGMYIAWRAMLDNLSPPPPPQGHPYFDYVHSPEQTGEGDQAALEAALVSSKAAAAGAGKSQIQLLADQVDHLFGTYATLQPGDDDRETFLWKYYLPHVVELRQKGYVEPFVYFANQRSNLPGVREWLTANQDRVNTFMLWSRSYKWPDRNSFK
jgi:tetratricopeptide (TPR) repeat protein